MFNTDSNTLTKTHIEHGSMLISKMLTKLSNTGAVNRALRLQVIKSDRQYAIAKQGRDFYLDELTTALAREELLTAEVAELKNLYTRMEQTHG
jgi:hypothetical protein